MFCSKCGCNVSDDASFCPRCGAVFASENQYPSEYQEGEVYYVYVPNPSKVLTLGIISTVICWFPCASIIAIIMGALNLGTAKRYTDAGAPKNGMITAGKVTSIIGIVAGSVVTALWVIALAFVTFLLSFI